MHFLYFSTLSWCWLLKFFLMWDKDLFILHSQYHDSWCPGDIKSPGISSYAIDLVFLGYSCFLHDQPWISPWIESISNELDIIMHVITSQLSGYCDVISRRKTEWVRHGDNVQRSSFLSSFMDSLCRLRNKIMYVLSWRTLKLTRVLFWYLFPSLLRNLGNKHQYIPLVSAETVLNLSTYIILYFITRSSKIKWRQRNDVTTRRWFLYTS